MSLATKTFLAALLLLTTALSRDAHADEDRARLAVVSFSTTLADAVTTALAAWKVRVINVDAGSVEAPQAATNAKSIAEAQRADVVVWIEKTPQGASLRVYDHISARVESRPLSVGPPYDEPTAAAVALTIKTLLRHSRVAPSAEDPSAIREGPSPPPISSSVSPPSTFSVRTGAGLVGRWRHRAPDELGLLLSAGLSMDRWFADTSVGIGLARRFTRSAGAGEFRSHDVVVQTGLRQSVAGGAVWVEASAGAGLAFTKLSLAAPSPLVVSRLNPKAALQLAVSASIGFGELGFFTESSVGLRRQRYEVDGALLFQVPRLQAATGILWRWTPQR